MEARPHPLVEAFIGRLLPPACREHVLGDLHERYVSASQYVHDAVRTIPFAIWGQRNLRIWWWTIAVLGIAGWLGLFVYPATSRFRPILLAWLIAFVVIGAYQRRRTRWPQPPQEGLATAGERQVYRAALERRRDEQHKWPARQPVLMIGVVGVALLFGAVGFLSPSTGPVSLPSVLVGSSIVAVLGLGMYLLTRRLTNRAAAAFQREIDALDSNLPDSGPE